MALSLCTGAAMAAVAVQCVQAACRQQCVGVARMGAAMPRVKSKRQGRAYPVLIARRARLDDASRQRQN